MEEENESKSRPGFYHGPVKGLGVAIILIGVICIGMGITSLTIALGSVCKYRNYYYDEYDTRRNHESTPAPYVHMCNYYATYSSPGIWSGLMFIASGIIGILAAKRKTTCFIAVMMILSILNVLVASGAITVAVFSMFDKDYNQINSYPTVLYILNACTGLFCFVSVIVSWITFGFGCRAVCCDGRKKCPSFGQNVQYQPLSNPIMMSSTSQLGGNDLQGDVPPLPEFPQTNMQPIYLVQGNQVIGILPQNPSQMTMGLAPGYSPPQMKQI
uniref:uncharacterized protein LOC120338890 n=1 Tax=Styela clava TaxID=7725 RepID=UPI001939D13D|nr:uncharacterized protein LOC120338890 [Styela clava]